MAAIDVVQNVQNICVQMGNEIAKKLLLKQASSLIRKGLNFGVEEGLTTIYACAVSDSIGKKKDTKIFGIRSRNVCTL